jgi:hypothetical protein
MASTDTQFPIAQRPGIFAAIASVFTRVVDEIVFLSEIRARAALMEELMNMSDAELEVRGLNRDKLFDLVFPARDNA